MMQKRMVCSGSCVTSLAKTLHKLSTLSFLTFSKLRMSVRSNPLYCSRSWARRLFIIPDGLASGSRDSSTCSPQKKRSPIRGPLVRRESASLADTNDTGDLLTSLELPFSKSAADEGLVSQDRSFGDVMSATERF